MEIPENPSGRPLAELNEAELGYIAGGMDFSGQKTSCIKRC